MTRLVVVGGGTETAAIEGISAAGADPNLRRHTPAADLEIVATGEPVDAPVVPVSPSGTPTPAVATRAVRDLLDLEFTAVNAGLPEPAGVATREVHDAPGGDIREGAAVPDAAAVWDRGRALGAELDAERLVIGETIPGGTTTALAVLTALGERPTVSSSLPENPLERKRQVVETALAAAGLSPGDAADDPVAAVRAVGDPVLAAIAGLVEGATRNETDVLLAGGTQLAAATALARHRGLAAPLTLATTAYVAADDSTDLQGLAADLDLSVRVTDPDFERHCPDAMAGYLTGEAKEGVGMGGALALAADGPASMATVGDRVECAYERLLAAGPSHTP